MERKGGLPINNKVEEVKKGDEVRVVGYGTEMQCLYSIKHDREGAICALKKLVRGELEKQIQMIQVFIKRGNDE